MRQTLALVKFVVALSSLCILPSHAENRVTENTREAQSWLSRIQSAAQKLNYAGTFVYQQGNQMRTSRVTHLLDGKNEIEKLEVLDGRPREYIRRNDEITCYVPEARTLIIEKRATPDVFPSLLAASPADLSQSYQLSKGETGRVAGHEAQAIILKPRDNLRYGYKFWAEKSSGLLLRAQTLDEKNDVVEQIAFTQISIGAVDKNHLRPSFPNTAKWHVENAITSQASLSGWSVKSVPAGFRKIREVKRMVADAPPIALPSNSHSEDRTPKQGAQREVSQLVFSDGVAAISVFVEPGTQSRTEGTMQQGAMNIVGKRQGDYWLTIVGEVPPAAIRQVANSIEFKSQ
jgi:sigma-E factor negative regulatory protein RseB